MIEHAMFMFDGNSKKVFSNLGSITNIESLKTSVLTEQSSSWVLEALNDAKRPITHYPLSADGFLSMIGELDSLSRFHGYNDYRLFAPENRNGISRGITNILDYIDIPTTDLAPHQYVFNRLAFPSDIIHSFLYSWIKPDIKIVTIVTMFEQSASKSPSSLFSSELIDLIRKEENIKIVVLSDNSEIGIFKSRNILRSLGMQPRSVRFAPPEITDDILLIGQLLEHSSALITQRNIIYDLGRLLKKRMIVLDKNFFPIDYELNHCKKITCDDLSTECEHDIPCVAGFNPRIVYTKLKEMLCSTGKNFS